MHRIWCTSAHRLLTAALLFWSLCASPACVLGARRVASRVSRMKNVAQHVSASPPQFAQSAGCPLRDEVPSGSNEQFVLQPHAMSHLINFTTVFPASKKVAEWRDEWTEDGKLVTDWLQSGKPALLRADEVAKSAFGKWRLLCDWTFSYIAAGGCDLSGLEAGKDGPQTFRECNPVVSVHESERAIVRMHHAVAPLAAVFSDDRQGKFAKLFDDKENGDVDALPAVEWLRPWREVNATLRELVACLRSSSNGNNDQETGKQQGWWYFMKLLDDLPVHLRGGAEPAAAVSAAHHPSGKPVEVMERNVWMGQAKVSTPLHYDIPHNLYLQVSGRKRFVLMGPDQWQHLYLFPRTHPASRQSQVDWELDPADARGLFPDIEQVTKPALEVTLEPGDLLYVPPYWGHYVSAEEFSVSLSTHVKSNEVDIRGAIDQYFAPVEETSLRAAAGEATEEEIEIAVRKILSAYVRALFSSRASLQKFLLRLIRQRYMALQHDRSVRGLWEHLVRGRDTYQPIRKSLRLTPALELAVREQIVRAEQFAKDFGETILSRYDREARYALPLKHIELGNYIEGIVGHYLGPFRVVPFLLEIANAPPV